MIARHDGRVVLVLGAIPGERVTASVERVESRLAFADTVDVLEASPDLRKGRQDLRCGGCLFAHVAYPRQLLLKAEIVLDAFARLARIPLQSAVAIAGSPERGYRMRARMHVRRGRAGFYREGTHELCDARATGQLSDESLDAVDAALASLGAPAWDVAAIELTENRDGAMRAAALEMTRAPRDPLQTELALERAQREGGLTGCTLRWPGGGPLVAGLPIVEDRLERLTSGRAASGSLSRHAESFFQANRYLLPDLVTGVIDAVPAEGEVLDLYAGVGLFAAALAGAGRARVTAVEGDRNSGADLKRNAALFPAAVRAVVRPVEDYLKTARGTAPATTIIDPPRTGVSREALASLSRIRPRTLVYVSCDPATMARDARHLIDAGYRLESLRGFDLFPNTPHVELLGVFGAG
jgi:tRNA/tmRNA/rRNA uracil-C5-methylase (TrmA/RlmC/RlmD family)